LAAAHLGATLPGGEIRIHAADTPGHELDEELCRRIRASVLFAGPLLARCGRATVPPPGGDVIGRRRLDTHMHAFEQLGAEIQVDRGYRMRADRLSGAAIFLDEASVTGTENAVMAAVLAKGETVIANAASEPHVQDLCCFLVSLGARIDGIGTNVLRVEGVERLHGGEWKICSDHIEVASFIGLGAVTPGEIVIEDVVPEHLMAIWPGFDRLGLQYEVEGTTVRVGDQELTIRDDLGAQIPKIEDGPWPAFPATDVEVLVAATHALGHPDLRENVQTGSSSTSSSAWGPGSSSATRTARSSTGRRSCTATGWRARTSARGWRC
jgi:UDP-N-acetylglucosamine 1-carboxyvinyltransferase